MNQKNFFRMMATTIVAGGIFAGCTQTDNPAGMPTHKGEYVIVQDSVKHAYGDYEIRKFEYDAQGRVSREFMKDANETGQIYSITTSAFTYSDNKIVERVIEEYHWEEDDIERDTVDYIYTLNAKGLIENMTFEYQSEIFDFLSVYSYDDQNRYIFYDSPSNDYQVVWENGDIVKVTYIRNDIVIRDYNYTPSDLEIDFPYLSRYPGASTPALACMGLYGKAPRHLLSSYSTVYNFIDGKKRETHTYNYVIEDGRVTEYIETEKRETLDGETVTDSSQEDSHHFLTWKKLE